MGFYTQDYYKDKETKELVVVLLTLLKIIV